MWCINSIKALVIHITRAFVFIYNNIIMNYETVNNQLQAANDKLTLMNAPIRLAIMSQNRKTRITVDVGTPEQIEQGTAQNTILSYATLSEASKFLMGFNSCLVVLMSYK